MYKIGMIIVLAILILLGLSYFVPSLQRTIPGMASSKNSHLEKFATWKEFTPQSELFKVDLPEPPQYAKDFVEIPDTDKKRRYDMYASEKIDGSLFLVNVITYPPEIDTSFTDDILKQNVMELMHSKPDNELARLEKSLYQTRPSFDFNFNNREFHVEGKALMDGKRVFILSYITRLKEFDPADYSYFIKSFQLLDKDDKQEEKAN